ncbi:hypothetical protein CPB86DRAFT_692717 [Serendipita vermifera]|nr:hypothetical protein CPB86DRAFT_692717 [Serendipita vermifera]
MYASRICIKTRRPFFASSHTSRVVRRALLSSNQRIAIIGVDSRRWHSDNKPPSNITRRENIYTIPNLLTTSRILSCPILGWAIVQGNFPLATGLLAYAGFSDLLDGYIARKYKSGTVLGSILDPAADKTLMTTLVISLAYQNMLPLPLAIIILGRDVLLSISAFYYRWISLPPPKTFTRYWDFSIPSAEVRPTQISKYNTFLQLILMGSTTISPLLPFEVHSFLTTLQWVVGGTTVWSGLSYVFSKDAVRILSKEAPKKPL